MASTPQQPQEGAPDLNALREAIGSGDPVRGWEGGVSPGGQSHTPLITRRPVKLVRSQIRIKTLLDPTSDTIKTLYKAQNAGRRTASLSVLS